MGGPVRADVTEVLGGKPLDPPFDLVSDLPHFTQGAPCRVRDRGCTSLAGSCPADSARRSPGAIRVKKTSAIWERPAFWVQTKRTYLIAFLSQPARASSLRGGVEVGVLLGSISEIRAAATTKAADIQRHASRLPHS